MLLNLGSNAAHAMYPLGGVLEVGLDAVDIPLAGKMFKDRAAVEDAIKGHILAQSELMGRYEKIKK